MLGVAWSFDFAKSTGFLVACRSSSSVVFETNGYLVVISSSL
jgi:hypothetical protein